MKAIKIDIRNKTVTEIELAKGIKTIYKELECQLFSCIGLPNTDCLYIDDEGLLAEEPIGAFMLNGVAQPTSGHGLIIGSDHNTGDSKDCTSTLEFIKANVEFVPVQILQGVPLQAGFIPLTVEEMTDYWQTGKLPIGKTPPSPQ